MIDLFYSYLLLYYTVEMQSNRVFNYYSMYAIINEIISVCYRGAYKFFLSDVYNNITADFCKKIRTKVHKYVVFVRYLFRLVCLFIYTMI